MKRWIWIGIGAATALLIFGIWNMKDRKYSLEYITGCTEEQIDSATLTDGTPQNAAELWADFASAEYIRYRGETGSTQHITWVFLGKDGSELFRLTDIGNRGLITITKDGQEAVYRMSQ